MTDNGWHEVTEDERALLARAGIQLADGLRVLVEERDTETTVHVKPGRRKHVPLASIRLPDGGAEL